MVLFTQGDICRKERKWQLYHLWEYLFLIVLSSLIRKFDPFAII